MCKAHATRTLGSRRHVFREVGWDGSFFQPADTYSTSCLIMTPLTSKQRAHLRKLAHHLKPIVLVGTDGVTDALLAAVADAFITRELLKVKLQESAPIDPREAAGQITALVEDSHSVQTIGRTVVLYRPHPENPELRRL